MVDYKLVHLKDIIVPPDRGRREFTKIQELADSIKKFGLIEPIVVVPAEEEPDKYILVAGERRFRASFLAGLGMIPTVLREDSEAVCAEIELEENTCRQDISWEEEGILFAKIQRLRKLANPKWGVVDTARIMGRTASEISNKIAIARKFKERPDMKKVCEKLPMAAALKRIAQIEAEEKVARMTEQGLITLSTELQYGNCSDLIKSLKNASIDLMVTDPPYGLEKMEKLREGSSSKMPSHQRMTDTHNMTLEEVLCLLSQLAPELHRVMKPGSHFYMFCGFQFVGDFIKALSPFLEFQPPLLIWDRGKPSAPGYGYNYLSRAEAIIYGCRPPRGRPLNGMMYNIIPCPDVPYNLRRYPTEKPVPLLQTLITNSTTTNDVVLDPFAGSASTLVAANASGRRAIGFETDKTSFLMAQKRLQDGEDI